ncbi:MAG: glycosyltransferase 61 family protein [Pseudomonadota bacterium]|nr:glycosyltransferase 61 family protein [Pseudomonadota bacterium]
MVTSRHTVKLTREPLKIYEDISTDSLFHRSPCLKPLQKPLFRRQKIFQGAHLGIKDARVCGTSNIIFDSNGFASPINIAFNPTNPDKVFGTSRDYFESDESDGYKFSAEKVIKIDEAIFIGGHENFGHWMHCHLGRLTFLKTAPNKIPIITHGNLLPNKIESIKYMLGGSTNVLPLNPNELLCAKYLFIPQMPWVVANQITVCDIEMFRELRTKLAVKKIGTGRRKIFLTREDAKWRRLLNQTEITSWLFAEGFEFINPAKLSFKQQVTLGEETKWLISIFGAGSNFFEFVPDDSVFIELCPPIKQRDLDINTRFAKMAGMRQVYRFEGIAAPAKGQSEINSDFKVDKLALETLIKTIEKGLTG